MSQRRAFITGVAGQDGSYLSELLLEKGYRVHGLIRHTTNVASLDNISHLLSVPDFELIPGDVTDRGLLERHLRLIKPHEVYNLAAQSHVGRSFEMPEATLDVTGRAVLGLLEAVRASGFNSRFYQASTSELFGNSSAAPQDETTPMVPVSPYGIAKLFAHHTVRMYREAYNMFACSGVLFNHESPRRGPDFVTQKVARGVARICRSGGKLRLGNLDARRDWGHARDYVRGMHMMLQHHTPRDFVLATGETHSIRELCDVAFKRAGLSYEGLVVIDPQLYRPIDVETLRGNPARAILELGWRPQATFEALVHEMVDAALEETQ